MPWPTTNPPVQPRRAGRALPRSRRRRSRPSPRRRAASRRPSRRGRSRSRRLHGLSVADVLDGHARPPRRRLRGTRRPAPRRGLAQHVVDRRGEEARLAPPARRRAEHDQVGAALSAPPRRSPAPIERARTSRPRPRRRGPRRAAAPRRARLARALDVLAAAARRAGASRGTRTTYSASTVAPRSCASSTAVATISSPIVAELHRHEDLAELGASRGSSSIGGDAGEQALPRVDRGRGRRRPARRRARPGRRSGRPGA